MKREALGLAVIAFALPWIVSCGSDNTAMADAPTGTSERIASVRTRVVEPEEVSDLAVFSADLVPLRRATLSAEVAGNVDSLKVELGQRVRKGQVLARIDTRALRQQLAEAEALFGQAQDRFERAEKLFEKRSITKEQHIDAVAGRDVAEARLASAQLRLEKSEVKAPWTGHVSAKRVEVGDYAGPGQPLIELVAMDRLKVKAPASAADVPYLKVGVPVVVRVDVYPGEIFEGEVVRMGAELDPSTRTLEVVAEIENDDLRLRPGLFGRMELERRVLSDALLVPLTSVVDFERRKVVYVVNEDVAELREVTLGPVVGQRVLITEGLNAGDRYVVTGQQGVADGQRVAESKEG
jgi:membrane fusion protein (multidrug efflux system)